MARKLGAFALTLLFSRAFAITPQGTFRQIIERDTSELSHGISKRSADVPAYNLSVPLDHFQDEIKYEPHTNDTFDLRYFMVTKYYKEGGPVIVMEAGEGDAESQLKFVAGPGVIQQILEATHGIGICLEHRYYGTSFPSVPDLSTENMRFLDVAQSAADLAYFAQHVVFPGFEDKNLTAANVPWILYGASYPGLLAAMARKLYPDVYWGAIASSATTVAIEDYWVYQEPIRQYGEKHCVEITEKITNSIDNIINLNSTSLTNELKAVWLLPNVTYTDDFVYAVSWGMPFFANWNWDPTSRYHYYWPEYCGNLTADEVLYSELEDSKGKVQEMLIKGGYESEVSSLTIPYLNWIGWLEGMGELLIGVRGCVGQQDYCYSNHNISFLTSQSIDDTWRSWAYQCCKELGLFVTSGVPADRLPLYSRLIDLPFQELACEVSFNITTGPDVEAVNKYGGFDIAYPRLAFIGGEQDPWRPCGPFASPFNTTAHNRTSTTSEPFLLIEGGRHGWDGYGVSPNLTTNDTYPPSAVKQVQEEEVQFVLEWLEEWKMTRGGGGNSILEVNRG